jgi:F0F1-type ATP synthase epsilon subunit
MADHPLFPVSVVTPEGPAFEGEAEMLIVPGAAGEIGVLARHAPLVAMLQAGSTRVHTGDGNVHEFATGPGFFQVLENRAIALVAVGGRSRRGARTQLEEARGAQRVGEVDRRPLAQSSGSATPRTSSPSAAPASNGRYRRGAGRWSRSGGRLVEDDASDLGAQPLGVVTGHPLDQAAVNRSCPVGMSSTGRDFPTRPW